MKRRTFLAGLASFLADGDARAQAANMPTVGFLHVGTDDAYTKNALADFRHGLRETGFTEGRNVMIEYRYAGNDASRLPELAQDLVRRNVAVIVELSGGSITAMAAKAATSTIPIVVAFGGDPVGLGLAQSLNRPGGNVTGITFYTAEFVGKRVELLCATLPQARRIAYLRPGQRLSSVVTEPMETIAREAARNLGRQLLATEIDGIEELKDAFADIVSKHADALVISSAPFFDTTELVNQLAALTSRATMPAIYQHRAFPAAGGLMSYGANQDEPFRQAGVYTGRILKGEKPADLPFQLSTKVEFVINLNTARAFGLTIPPSVLGRADEVIE